MTATDWLLNHSDLSAAIALIALLRPEISSLLIRWKAKIDFHVRPSRKIIVGFRGIPFCWLDGTIESVAGNNLIEDMMLRVTRTRDQATYELQWVLWESTIIGENRASPAYAFQLFQNAAINGLLSFRDELTAERYASELKNLREGFEYYLKGQFSEPDVYPDDVKPIFEDFVKQSTVAESYSNALSRIQRAMYWDAGKYACEFHIKTKRPNKSYLFTFEFELNTQDQRLLEENAIRTIWSAIGVKNVIFNQVEPSVQNFKVAS